MAVDVQGIGLGMSLAGAATSAYSAWQSSKFQQRQLGIQAELADLNADIAQRGAESAMIAGQKQESAVRSRTAQVKSSQRAAMGASSVDLGTGSAANILTTTDVMGEIDANAAALNTLQSAWGYTTQAMNTRASAANMRGMAAGINPGVNAVGSLLNSAPAVASSWYKNKQGTGVDQEGKK